MTNRKRIVILTSSELRHDFFRKAVGASGIHEVTRSYCEGLEKSLRTLAGKKGTGKAELELAHLRKREQAEEDFFRLFVDFVSDKSNPVFVKRGAINEPEQVEAIQDLNPDFIVAYGCSLISGDLLSRFDRRILNVHLGLSPYYRGSGTNFWPFVEGKPEYVGATFMFMDEGIDTGEVIHQIRPRIFPGDDFHRIGNRFIGDMTRTYIKLLSNVDQLSPMPQIAAPPDARLYLKKHFTNDAVVELHRQMESGLIDRYVDEQCVRCAAVPIVENPVIAEA